MIHRYKKHDWHIVNGATPHKDIRVHFSVFVKELDAQLKWCKINLGPRGKLWRYQYIHITMTSCGGDLSTFFKIKNSHYFMFKEESDALAFRLAWE